MTIFACLRQENLITNAIEIFENITKIKIAKKDCLYKIEYNPETVVKFRIIRPEKNELNLNYTSQEIEFEKEKIQFCKCGKGLVYSALHLVNYLKNLDIFKKIKFQNMPVFITEDYIATFDENDKRWHLRYALFFYPTIISIPGIIEAPAKPKEYYFYLSQGILPEIILEKLKGRYLTYNDERLPRVLAGILLQSLFYYKTGNPFCENPLCSLYNAHWQEELINSQKNEPYILCEKHSKNLMNFI